MVSEMNVEQELEIQVETVEIVVGTVVKNAQNIEALVYMAVVVAAVDVVVVDAVAVAVAAAVVTVEMPDKKLSNS